MVAGRWCFSCERYNQTESRIRQAVICFLLHADRGLSLSLSLRRVSLQVLDSSVDRTVQILLVFCCLLHCSWGARAGCSTGVASASSRSRMHRHAPDTLCKALLCRVGRRSLHAFIRSLLIPLLWGSSTTASLATNQHQLHACLKNFPHPPLPGSPNVVILAE